MLRRNFFVSKETMTAIWKQCSGCFLFQIHECLSYLKLVFFHQSFGLTKAFVDGIIETLNFSHVDGVFWHLTDYHRLVAHYSRTDKRDLIADFFLQLLSSSTICYTLNYVSGLVVYSSLTRCLFLTDLSGVWLRKHCGLFLANKANNGQRMETIKLMRKSTKKGHEKRKEKEVEK